MSVKFQGGRLLKTKGPTNFALKITRTLYLKGRYAPLGKTKPWAVVKKKKLMPTSLVRQKPQLRSS